MRTAFCSLLATAMLLGGLSWAFAAGTVVKTTGTVTASGNGIAQVRIIQGTATFTGQGRLRVSPSAQVTITAGTADKPVTETSKNGKATWVLYKHFNGTATVTGAHIHARLAGKNITLNTQGAGFAHLIGTGTYTTQTQGKTAENGKWAAKPTGKAPAGFWKSIRRVYGDFDLKNGKEAEDGSTDLE